MQKLGVRHPNTIEPVSCCLQYMLYCMHVLCDLNIVRHQKASISIFAFITTAKPRVSAENIGLKVSALPSS